MTMTEEQEQTDVVAAPYDITNQPFLIEDVLVDPIERRLEGDGVAAGLTLEHKVMEVLVFLSRHAGSREVVTYGAILKAVWPDTVQEETAVYRAVSMIRKALGTARKFYIETIPQRGYRMVAEVRQVPSESADDVIVVPEPSGRTITGRTWMAGIAAAVLVLAGLGFVMKDRLLDDAPAPSGKQSLAVLAFNGQGLPKDLAGVPRDIAAELIHVLSNIEDFEVVSRRTSFLQDNQNADARKFKEVLGVDFVIDGRVTPIDGKLNIAVEMAETSRGRHYWHSNFQYERDSYYAAAPEIATRVADALQVALSAKTQAAIDALQPDNQDAFRAYTEARKLLRGPRELSKLGRALDLFSEAKLLDPDFQGAQIGTCQTYVAMFQVRHDVNYSEQAEDTCQGVLAQNPGNPQARVALGMLYRHRGDYERSEENLRAVVGAFPEDSEALVELGDTLLAAGRVDEAGRILEQAAKAAPNEYDAQAALGVFYYQTGKLRDALAQFSRAERLNPNSPKPRSNLGSTHFRLGQFDLAIRNWEIALAMGETRLVLTNLGLAHYYMGEFEQAAQYHERARAMAPQDHRVLGRLAEVLRFIPGNGENSQVLYQQAVDAANTYLLTKREDAMAYARLGNFRAHLQQYEQMRSAFALAHELSPDAEQIYYIEAVSYAALRQHEPMLRALRIAAELGTSRALILNDPDVAALADRPEVAEFLASL